MNEEESDYINQLQQQNEAQNRQLSQLSSQTNSVFMATQDKNLIEWQLELDNILERIDHLLRGHVVTFDADGGLKYSEPKDKRFKIFNEYGVQEILRVLSMYLNRNTILSNYEEEVINMKMLDLSKDLIDLIYLKYEEMFYYKSFDDWMEEEGYKKYEDMPKELIFKINKKVERDLASKEKLYHIIIRFLVDTVHSAYLRALGGGERESLRTARTVSQSEPLGANNMPPPITQSRGRWNPMSLFRG